MTVTFKARTNNAYNVKILAELLSNNIKVAHFEITPDKISLRMMDTHRKILIDLHLKAENFSIYKVSQPKLYIGINLSHLHRMLRSVKKKDILELTITDENPTKLCIKVFPKENNRVTTSFITIQSVQEIDIDIPEFTNKPIVISSSEFQKIVKEMSSIGNLIRISARDFHIKFSCETGGIIERAVEFGEVQDDDAETGNEFDQTFMTEQLSRITKIAGLSSSIKVYPGNPLMFKSTIDNMGEIQIFIKNKDQLESEMLANDELYHSE